MPAPNVALEAVKIGPKKVEDVKVTISTKKDEVEPLNPSRRNQIINKLFKECFAEALFFLSINIFMLLCFQYRRE